MDVLDKYDQPYSIIRREDFDVAMIEYNVDAVEFDQEILPKDRNMELLGVG